MVKIHGLFTNIFLKEKILLDKHFWLHTRLLYHRMKPPDSGLFYGFFAYKNLNFQTKKNITFDQDQFH